MVLEQGAQRTAYCTYQYYSICIRYFPVLPAPVLNNPTSAMQKQLQRVKKERMESESETPVKQTNINVVSEPTPVSQLLAAQTLLQPPSTSSGSSVQTLDEILKKYKMNISTSK